MGTQVHILELIRALARTGALRSACWYAGSGSTVRRWSCCGELPETEILSR